MLSLDQVLEKLKDRNLRKVAEGSDISVATIYKIVSGRSVETSYIVVKKLSDYLEANP